MTTAYSGIDVALSIHTIAICVSYREAGPKLVAGCAVQCQHERVQECAQVQHTNTLLIPGVEYSGGNDWIANSNARQYVGNGRSTDARCTIVLQVQEAR